MQLCVLFCRSVNTEADGVAELLLPFRNSNYFLFNLKRKNLKKPNQQTKKTKAKKSLKQKRQKNPQTAKKNPTKKTSETQAPTTLKCVCLHAHTFLGFQYKFLHSQIFLPVGIALCFTCCFWPFLVRASSELYVMLQLVNETCVHWGISFVTLNTYL